MNRIQYRGKWYTFPEAIEAGLVQPTRHRDREERDKRRRASRPVLLRPRKEPDSS
ncbi:MAG: hypothetical protein QJR06_03980 [Alicyclobacillaceae bacterium]|nr:hypothetical protein [Alicyclobacillaceae bacterium]